MSDKLSSDLNNILAADPRASRVTEEGVAKALEGFSLPLRCDFPSLVAKVRIAVYGVLTPNDQWHDERRENCDVRDELFRLAEQVQGAWQALQVRGPEVDGAIFDACYRNFRRNGEVTDADDDLVRPFHAAVGQMEFLFSFLRHAGMQVAVQKAGWRRIDDKEQRIRIAQALAAVFEEAYGRKATLTRGPLAKNLGPWADFFKRIIALVMGGAARRNAEDVLRAAGRRRKAAGG